MTEDLNLPDQKCFANNISEIKTKNTGFANNIYECKSEENLFTYYHLACFSPVKSTWIKAIKNNFFTSWPGLTAKLVENTSINLCLLRKVTSARHRKEPARLNKNHANLEKHLRQTYYLQLRTHISLHPTCQSTVVRPTLKYMIYKTKSTLTKQVDFLRIQVPGINMSW